MNDRFRRTAVLCAFLVASVPDTHAAPLNVDPFVKKDAFESIKISPDGTHLAATVPMEDRTALVVMERAGNKLVSAFSTGRNTHVAEFDWVSSKRVLISTSEKFGQLDQPQLTGEIYGLSITGGADILVGQRVGEMSTGSRIQRKKAELIAAFLVDDLPKDDDNVLISVSPFTSDPFTRLELMDVHSGRRIPVSRAPVRNARFLTDNSGTARFALGFGADNASKLYYRAGNGAEWSLVNDQSVTGRNEFPIGFSADDTVAYLQAEQDAGPDAIVAYETATGTRRQILRDADTDPGRIIYRPGTGVPVGAFLYDGKGRSEFFDPAAPEARLQRSLEAVFAGNVVEVTSSTADGGLALVYVHSDRNPGDFYLFDTVAKKADHVISRRTWFDPDKMAEARPVSLAARDGTPLRGFLTVPRAATGKLPMVVMPHGGPYGIFETWTFEDERQMLAAAGYAVLQVNFRGSGNQGRAFMRAGARQWGGTMQDDVTDATRWAIQEGHADPGRICIVGGSYGGYAALMGVAKEPTLYRCAAGYVGVYDLPMMHVHGDIQRRGSGESYLREWIGERGALAEASPTTMAARIKAPVFLAAGREDERAPVEHTEKMERALKAAGVPVEAHYYKTEGHGFYVEANRKDFYTRLLSFLDRHIGAAGGTPTAAN